MFYKHRVKIINERRVFFEEAVTDEKTLLAIWSLHEIVWMAAKRRN